LWKARAKRKNLGRPPVPEDAARIGILRTAARTVCEIAGELGYSRGLVHKTLAHSRLNAVANGRIAAELSTCGALGQSHKGFVLGIRVHIG
jgi:hypothetical protein